MTTKKERKDEGRDSQTQFIEVMVSELEPWADQPRTIFNENTITEMADSFGKSDGVINPIIIRPHPKPHGGIKYQIIAGERRFRAAKIAKIKSLSAILKNIKDEDMLKVAVLDNLHREELNSVDEAYAFKRLMEENGWNASQLARYLGKSPAWVTTQRLSLLELAKSVQEMVREKKLPVSTAVNLKQFKKEHEQTSLAYRILTKGMTAKEVIS